MSTFQVKYDIDLKINVISLTGYALEIFTDLSSISHDAI